MEGQQEFAEAFGMAVCIAGIICLSIGIWLLARCYMKRQSTRQIKEQMQTKRYQYASTLGINLYELNNDPRLSYTIHV
jgi:hypothetical protein